MEDCGNGGTYSTYNVHNYNEHMLYGYMLGRINLAVL